MCRFLLFTFLILCVACTTEEKYELKLSDEQFTSVLLDIEMAKEASRTASMNIQDSLRTLYYGIIAKEYSLTIDEMKLEVEVRMGEDHDMDKIYDGLKAKIDSIAAKSRPKTKTKIETELGPKNKKGEMQKNR